jgi:NAD(P) transhydrogenase subunit alpha
MSGVDALYLVLLAGVAGYVLIARVPSILHTPMMSGSNFIHGIVLCGSMLALSNASTVLEQIIGFIAVMAGAANVIGGFVVTDRMLALFNNKNNGVSRSLIARDNPASEDRRVPTAVTKPGNKA